MSEKQENGFEDQNKEKSERAGQLGETPGAGAPEPGEKQGATEEERKEDPGHRLPPVEESSATYRPRLTAMRRGRKLVKKEVGEARQLKAEERLLLLDTWRRSGLPARDFGPLVGVSRHTLYVWKKKFDDHGPAGLVDQQKGLRGGSRLPELTRRTILMLKQDNPEWGCRRISDMLVRGPALPASPSAVARVLHEAGYELKETPTRVHKDKKRCFERARPNQLWQTDIFTFMLKRQNRRVYLVAFLDDHSRFVVSFGLHASQSTALVLEALRGGIASWGAPEEILTDNGTQYVTWRGKSAFTKELEKRGIKHLVSRPRHPQTLGKIERFWGTLWRDCVETAIYTDLGEARERIGLFLDYYNFERPHQGIDGLVPADRFFHAAPEVLRTLKARVAENALEIARSGRPKNPFYLTGRAGGRGFSVHARGERVILMREGGEKEEVELTAPSSQEDTETPEKQPEDKKEPPPPGVFPLDEGLAEVAASLKEAEEKGGES